MSRTQKIDKQASNVTYTGAWTGGAGGAEVYLEPASNVTNAEGTFGDSTGKGKPLATEAGAGAVRMQNGVHFNYDSKLNATGGSNVDVYDTSTGGALAAGKYVRIVDNTKNIVNPAGLNIQDIYAKVLMGSPAGMPTPTKTAVYIDPIQGNFVLPRPLYFSRCESASNLYGTPDLYQSDYPPSTYTTGTITSETYANTASKFGNGLYLNQYLAVGYNTSASATYQRGVYPVNTNLDWSKGTASAWWYLNDTIVSDGVFTKATSQSTLLIYLTSNFYIKFDNLYSNLVAPYSLAQIVVNGSVVSSAVITPGSVQHVGIVWDTLAGLSGSKTVRVFIDNAEVASTTNALPSLASCNLQYQMYVYAYGQTFLLTSCSATANLGVDNVKIFSHVVSEDFAWEYNGGSGNEYGLHSIYGSGNNYQPQIVGVNGVGYFYLQASTAPVSSYGTGIDETETLITSPTTDATGSFNGGGSLCNDSMIILTSGTEFLYSKRLDANTVEDATNGFGLVAGGITDTAAAGALAVGKYLRLVDNGVNVKDADYPTAGYGGLQVFALPLNGSSKTWTSPTKERMYLDPITGYYVMPRPTFFSRCEYEANLLTTPDIYNGTNPPTTTTYGTFTEAFGVTGAKFGNGWYISDGNHYYGPLVSGRYIKFIPTSINWNKGTLSCWSYGTSSAVSSGLLSWGQGKSIFTFGPNNTYLYRQDYSDSVPTETHKFGLVVGGVEQINFTTTNSTIYHVYMVWDFNKGLAGGKSVRVFINETEVLSTTATLSDASSYQLQWQSDLQNKGAAGAYGTCGVGLDNIKIFQEVASEDPTWEYNSGAGRELAMHEIYGSTNSYVPNLGAAGSGVGYYRQIVYTRQCLISI